MLIAATEWLSSRRVDRYFRCESSDAHPHAVDEHEPTPLTDHPHRKYFPRLFVGQNEKARETTVHGTYAVLSTESRSAAYERLFASSPR